MAGESDTLGVEERLKDIRARNALWMESRRIDGPWAVDTIGVPDPNDMARLLNKAEDDRDYLLRLLAQERKELEEARRETGQARLGRDRWILESSKAEQRGYERGKAEGWHEAIDELTDEETAREMRSLNRYPRPQAVTPPVEVDR